MLNLSFRKFLFCAVYTLQRTACSSALVPRPADGAAGHKLQSERLSYVSCVSDFHFNFVGFGHAVRTGTAIREQQCIFLRSIIAQVFHHLLWLQIIA